MLIGIVSDIHANLAAFQTVLAALEQVGATKMIWCLGDMVGYGPKPNECLNLLRSYDHICVPGNHDWGVLGLTPAENFNGDARAVLEWTQRELTPDNKAYLKNLPLRWLPEPGGWTVVHASPRDPIWEYLLEKEEARENFPFFETPFCFVGHTHVPVVFRQAPESGSIKKALPQPTEQVFLGQARLIMNPGSVGQPRDGNPQAAFGILDTTNSTFHFLRIDYPIQKTQEEMKQLGFPKKLIARLGYGF